MVFSTQFLGFIQGLKIFSLRLRRDDDFCDRLNHHNTALFLLITSIFIGSNQYVGNPIHCWVPKEFTGVWQKYADNYCWIKNTYIIPPNDLWEIPKPHERRNLEINYYQWVPVVLIIQSFMFYFPTIIWRILNWTLGINVQELVTKAMNAHSKIEEVPKAQEPTELEKKMTSLTEDMQKILATKNDLGDTLTDGAQEELKNSENEKSPMANKDKTDAKNNSTETEVKSEKELNIPSEVVDIAEHLGVVIESVSSSQSGMLKSILSLFICSFGSRKYGCYLISLYLLTKVLYIINVVGQLFLLNSFIGTTYRFFGFQMLNDLVKGNDWKNTGHFPRVTMCDFEIRNLGQRTNYTVQCVLPINLFNEKVYIFIWFWIFFVAVLTIFSFFHWIIRMLRSQKNQFIKGFLLKSNDYIDDRHLTGLLNTLKSDGMFLIYLIYVNAGDLVTKELVETLWLKYKPKSVDVPDRYPEYYKQKKKSKDDADNYLNDYKDNISFL